MIRKSAILTLIGIILCAIASAQAPIAQFTATPVAGCSPLVVSFTDQSSGSPTTWFWNFGNGATSTLKNPSTTYFSPGTYTVTLTVTNASGSHTLTRSGFVTVYGKPVVQFKASDSIGCYPFPVRFSDLSTASEGTTNTSWIWDLGDGTQSGQQNPQNTYVNTGNYTVSLKVTNDKGCWNVATKAAYIKIDGGVKADFSYFQPIACRTPITINFANASTGPGTLSYDWQFGDGGSSTAANPTHTYTAPGTYSVTLITTSSNGCRDTMRKANLFQIANTHTSFSAPENACIRQPVTFLNTSSDSASSTHWDFGNGTTTTVTNPVTSFSSPGTYTVKLVQAYGPCADSAFKTITVHPRPAAAFTADKTTHCQAPLTVQFQNSTSGAVSYEWHFGDGATSSQQHPAHTYTSFGSFDVTLIVTSAQGCTDTLKKPGYISITRPAITFTTLPQMGCIPYSVAFAASISSPDAVSSYLWSFGNGVTSTQAAPTYTYTSQGTYTVSLTITTASGCTETYSMPSAVTVGTKPRVAFSATPRQVCAYQEVFFTDHTTGGATEYLWLFGDGGSSTEQHPKYQYGDTGVFNVQLIVTNNGCKDSLKIDSLIRVKPPIAQFSYTSDCTNKLFYTFTNRSIGATSWLWDFGDGTTSTQQHPVHTFPRSGTFLVQLTVSNDTCHHTKKIPIRVITGKPDFTALPAQACKGSIIGFSADTTNSAEIIAYKWNFGHGGPEGTGITAATTYPLSGNYTVSLTATYSNGCIDSIVKPQYVRINGPTARFLTTNGNGCKGLTASFTDQSFGDGVSAIVSWTWNLGDGTVLNHGSSTNIQHTYHTAGTYPVSLKVVDAGGCSDSLLLAGAVNTTEIKAAFSSADTATCPGALVAFANTSQSTTSYNSLWTFGDGSTAIADNPQKSYAADGRYTVTLKITDRYGCADSLTRTDYISVKSPVARYSVSDSASACTPFQVQFTNESEYYTDFLWDLGGGTSRLANPVQFYNQPGVYRTKLVVTSPGGCKDTAAKDIHVYDVSRARIDYTPLHGCKPLTVQLHASGSPLMTYTWDFGDGALVNNTDTTTTHVYHSFGDFVPKIIMHDASGCVIPVLGLDTIRIKGATAKFGANNQLLCDRGWVQFTDSTTFNNPIISYLWDFGDGTTANTTSPAHYYSQPGLYQVLLNVRTQNNCVDTFQLQYPIKVVASPDIYIGGDSVICVGEGINHMGLFARTDTSTVLWAWKFPNGKTSSAQLPPRQYYKATGDFIVQATAQNNSGCRDTAFKNIRVNPIPSVTIPSPLTTIIGTPVLVPAVYSGGVQSYHWSTPEGLSCTTCPQPMANPKSNTRYVVQFTDSNGCRNTGEVDVIVICKNANVFVPNTFSPNGDGSNDIFYVRGQGLNRVKMLRIFNRWGQIVYERTNFQVNDPTAGWDGTFKGNKPVPDVYVYQVEVFCDNSQIIQFEGNIALIQ